DTERPRRELLLRRPGLRHALCGVRGQGVHAEAEGEGLERLPGAHEAEASQPLSDTNLTTLKRGQAGDRQEDFVLELRAGGGADRERHGQDRPGTGGVWGER